MKLPRTSPLCAIGVALALAAAAMADPLPLALKVISGGQLIAPVTITNAGDGSKRIFVCDQVGQIRIISNEMLLPVPFLDLSARMVPLSSSYDERGLLGLAFHPQFANASSPGYGKFYVFYSAPSPNAPGTATSPVNCRSTVSEFQVSAGDPNVADPTTERPVISWDKPQMNHNGGQLAFGPDGYLYITVGDGGSQHDNDYGHTGGSSVNGTASPTGNLGNAQDTTKLLGKILRIDPLGSNGPGGSYGIPGDNPFAGAVGGVRQEIYTFGMRNPWRMAFDNDPVNGWRLIEGDVGQDNVEEINLIVSGGNYGWRIMEGTFSHDSTAPGGGGALINPVAEYAHVSTNLTNYPGLSKIGTAVIGGYVYRGNAIPALTGQYVFADYSASSSAAGLLLTLDASAWALSQPVVTAVAKPLVVGTTPFYVLSMGRDEDGELYVGTEVTKGPHLNQPTGGICKIVAAQVSNVTLAPVKDNTVFSESSSLSNALGNIYAGETAEGALRRGLMAFDIAGNVPAGAVISSAQLTLNMNSASASGASNMSLFRLSESWGEGTSGPSTGMGAAATTGDATWGNRYYDPSTPTNWIVAGGTHTSTASATTSVGTASGYYTWSSSQMATDVQGWLGTPATNYGWLLIGDETTLQTARAFDSRESAANVQPALQITYAAAPALTWRETWLHQYFSPIGTYVADLAAPNGSSINNLMAYAFALSPLAVNPPSAGFQVTVTTNGTNDTFTITFRRDPRATDLTYQLQTSGDLSAWTTIAQSTAGAVSTGSGFVSESVIPGNAPVVTVTAQETLPSPAKRFSRLLVLRAY
jgi:glucose/arabinose dehydrogenase